MSLDTDCLVRFGRNEHGHISVHVPETHRPVLWILEDLPTWAWPEILEHARHPTDEEYITGGNAYDILIDRNGVTIEDQLDETTLTTIPHRDLITIVEGYLTELDRWRTERDTTDH